jgi:hypothetical protein
MSNACLLCCAFFVCLPLTVRTGMIGLLALCDGVAGVPVDDSVSCSAAPVGGSASASVNIVMPWEVGVSASGLGAGAYAQASYGTTLVIDFTGGVGAGFLCSLFTRQ